MSSQLCDRRQGIEEEKCMSRCSRAVDSVYCVTVRARNDTEIVKQHNCQFNLLQISSMKTISVFHGCVECSQCHCEVQDWLLEIQKHKHRVDTIETSFYMKTRSEGSG